MNIDDRVKVWDSPGFGYHKMHFAGWDKDGKIMCFRGGKTSWSGKSTKTWENYEKDNSSNRAPVRDNFMFFNDDDVNG